MSTYEMLEHSPTQAKDEEFVLRDLVRMIGRDLIREVLQ